MTSDLPPLPQDMRWQLNMELGDKQLNGLDSNGRFIVRRMVAAAYAKGFSHGWLAGLHDSQTDEQIARDAQKQENN